MGRNVLNDNDYNYSLISKCITKMNLINDSCLKDAINELNQNEKQLIAGICKKICSNIDKIDMEF